MRFLELDAKTLVADAQLRASDIETAAAHGVTMIVNNRPDGEEPGQPAGAEIAAAAREAGLAYRHIPVGAGLTGGQVEAMAAALEETEGKVLAFCRSGTRSACLWALARHRRGQSSDALLRQAEAAGYDLGPLKHYLS